VARGADFQLVAEIRERKEVVFTRRFLGEGGSRNYTSIGGVIGLWRTV